MRVHVPTPLRSYTGKEAVIEATGSNLGELLAGIDRRYPGFRFRIIDEQRIISANEYVARLDIAVDPPALVESRDLIDYLKGEARDRRPGDDYLIRYVLQLRIICGR